MASTTNTPINPTRLRQIAMDACQVAVGSAEYYEHSRVEGWNSTIIVRLPLPCPSCLPS
ncbi:hypothetical protein F5B18DRAFT_600543 [Nemania serpens]|nr:hypothetical protein F5B18DRAFT_600543 [Nemania serpens]